MPVCAHGLPPGAVLRWNDSTAGRSSATASSRRTRGSWIRGRPRRFHSRVAYSPLTFWRAGLVSGIRMVVAEPLLGFKRVILPVSYWRAVEFGFAARALARLPPGARVLDVGSPKELAVFCAERFGVEVTATDILQEE